MRHPRESAPVWAAMQRLRANVVRSVTRGARATTLARCGRPGPYIGPRGEIGSEQSDRGAGVRRRVCAAAPHRGARGGSSADVACARAVRAPDGDACERDGGRSAPQPRPDPGAAVRTTPAHPAWRAANRDPHGSLANDLGFAARADSSAAAQQRRARRGAGVQCEASDRERACDPTPGRPEGAQRLQRRSGVYPPPTRARRRRGSAPHRPLSGVR